MNDSRHCLNSVRVGLAALLLMTGLVGRAARADLTGLLDHVPATAQVVIGSNGFDPKTRPLPSRFLPTSSKTPI